VFGIVLGLLEDALNDRSAELALQLGELLPRCDSDGA
jgi:hypothetical protein